MDPELKSVLDRADELLRDLEDEYNKCLKAQSVTVRARNITDEVLQKLRSALDQTMTRAWGKYIKPKLSKHDAEDVRVYFPTGKNPDSLRSILGQGYMKDLDKDHKSLYDFLLAQQPFESTQNQWLELLREITAKGKHVRLTPQKRTESRRIKVTRPGAVRRRGIHPG